MRTVTSGEQTVLEGKHYATHVRVLVEDADGTYQDLTDQDSLDWLYSGSVTQTIDQIVATARMLFWLKQEGGNSLAPLDEDSTLNRDAMAAYAPLIDVGRGVRVEVATVAIGSSPSGGDWKRIFDGTIDEWDISDPDFIQVFGRDAIGAELADAWVESETEYGSGGGTAIETVMQSILTDWTDGPLSLYTPSSPSFLITTYNQQRMSVLQALQQLAALIGWVVEPRWDDGTSAFRLTFYEPDRTASVTDWTWASDHYETVPEFRLSRLNVRNALSGWYTDANGVRQQRTVEDATSIAKYRRQFMEIEEASDSAINTAAEMDDMLTAAILDLKDPVALSKKRTMLFWPIQLGDFYGFTGNAHHYSEDQEWGVTGFSHEWSSDGHIDTVIHTRGKPAGFSTPWLRRGGTNYLPPARPQILNVEVDWQLDGTALLSIQGNADAGSSQAAAAIDGPFPSDATVDAASGTLDAYDSDRRAEIVLGPFDVGDEVYFKIGVYEGTNGAGVKGEYLKFIVVRPESENRVTNLQATLRPIDGVGGRPAWVYDVTGTLGRKVRSYRVDYSFIRPHITADQPPPSTTFPRDYNVDASGPAALEHVLEDGVGAEQEFLAQDNAGTTIYDSNFYLIVTPYDDTGGAGGSGSAGEPIRILVPQLDGTGSGVATDTSGGQKIPGNRITFKNGITVSWGADGTPHAEQDIDGLTEDGSPDGANDYVTTYDASAGAVKKVLLDNLPGSGGVTDHGALTGLGDDDHTQYYNAARHTKAVHDALGIDHGSLSGLSDDDHPQYAAVAQAETIAAQWKHAVHDYGSQASSFNLDGSNGNIQRATLNGGSVTITPTNLSAGHVLLFLLEYGGAYTPTWSGVDWGDAGEPGWTADGSYADLVYILRIGNVNIGTAVTGFANPT